MWTGKLGNREVELNSRDYKILVQRFNDIPFNNKLSICCICGFYIDCAGCPLVPCGQFANYYDSDKKMRFSYDSVSWRTEDNEKALQIINKIKSDLEAFKEENRNTVLNK